MAGVILPYKTHQTRRITERSTLNSPMINPGTKVRFAKIPPWLEKLPEESRRVFHHCLGHIYTAEEVDSSGLLVLDVSADVDEHFGGFGNDIRLEAEFLEEVT